MNKTMLVLVAALLVAPLAYAGHSPDGRCGSDGEVALGIIAISGGSADTTFYADDRNFVLGNGFWVYQETNGIWTGTDPTHDLQRGGASAYVPDDAEICVDDADVIPDTLVF